MLPQLPSGYSATTTTPIWILKDILVAGWYFCFPSDKSYMLILRYIQKSISSLCLYDWILSAILSPVQQLFCEGPDPFDSSSQGRFLFLMLLDWPVVALSVLTYFGARQKGQVPAAHSDTSTAAPRLCGQRTRCCRTARGRAQPVFSDPAQHLCLAAKYSDKSRQRGLLKQTCGISGLNPDAQDSVGNSRSHSRSV